VPKTQTTLSALEIANEYAAGVIDGTVPACNSIKLAVQRYLSDLEKVESGKKDWYFDEDKAQRVIDFFQFLQPSQGEFAGKPLELMPWQIFIICNIYGWYKPDGTRRFREGYVEIPRKNGKSTLLSGVGLYMLFGDGEPGSQVYTAASKKDQARIIWDESVKMVNASPNLKKHLKCFQTAIVHAESNSKFCALASEDDTLSGLNPHCGLIDEIHELPNRKVYDIIVTALGTRRQPLIFGITTSGWNRESLCWKQHEYAMKVLTGVFDDEGSESFFAFIATLDEGADWKDEKNWYKVNPSLGFNKKISYMRQLASKAKAEPASLNAFLRFELCVWTQQESKFIPMADWDKCTTGGDYKKLREDTELRLKDRICFGGLDLSTTVDLTAFALYFPPCGELKEKDVILRAADPKGTLLTWCFIPQDNIMQRVERDRVPYDSWQREDFIECTPGNQVDYEWVRAKILELGSRYSIQEIGVDPWNSTQIVQQLGNDGYIMAEIRQGDISMTAPLKELLRIVMTHQLDHLGSPVLRWQADNLVVRVGPTSLMKPDKEHSSERIDAIVAALMAIGRATAVAPEDDDAAGVEVW
jgi:phage terminase large subunit-like protein